MPQIPHLLVLRTLPDVYQIGEIELTDDIPHWGEVRALLDHAVAAGDVDEPVIAEAYESYH